jgi:hypothetical protein
LIVEGARVLRIAGGAGSFEVDLHDGRSVRSAIVVHCTSALARELDTTGLLARTVFAFRGQVLPPTRCRRAVACSSPRMRCRATSATSTSA